MVQILDEARVLHLLVPLFLQSQEIGWMNCHERIAAVRHRQYAAA